MIRSFAEFTLSEANGLRMTDNESAIPSISTFNNFRNLFQVEELQPSLKKLIKKISRILRAVCALFK